MARGFGIVALLWLFAAMPCHAEDEESLVNEEHGDHGHHEQSRKIMCGVDVSQATLSLGRAGMAVNAAVKTCSGVEEAGHRRLGSEEAHKHEGKASCSAKVSEVLLSFTEVASFLVAAATNCAKTLHLDALCAADISGFIGACSVVARAGSGMQQACKNVTAGVERVITGHTRRLNSAVPVSDPGPLPAQDPETPRQVLDKLDEHAKEIQAECTFDVGQATLFLIRAGMAIHGAVEDCDSFVLEDAHGEHSEHDHDHRLLEETGVASADGSQNSIHGPKLAKRICAIDVGGIIGSFSHAASFLAFAGNHCPGASALQAACSAEVLSVVGALSQFAAAGASFDLACGKRAADGVQHLGERPYRRLVEDVTV